MTSRPLFHLLRQRVDPSKHDFARHLRRSMTPAELALWKQLRSPATPCRVRRQALIAGYIADFYCSSLRLVIEVDGPVHARQQDYDRQRDHVMRELGLNVVRVANDDVLRDPRGVATWVMAEGRRWMEQQRTAAGDPP